MVIKLRYNIMCFLIALILIIGTCFAVEDVQIKKSEKTNTEKVALPIIMYHHILPKENKLLGRYALSVEKFEQDLIYIKEQGFNTVTSKQVIDYVENDTPLPSNPIMITFDDGYESFYKYAYPLLKKHYMNAIVSIIGVESDRYSSENLKKGINYSHLSWEQIRELSNSGFIEIQNHTYDLHKNDTSKRKGCSIKKGENLEEYKKLLYNDLNKTQQKITEITGITPTIFTYPFGNVCKQSQEVIEQLQFKISLGCEEKINYLSKDMSLYKLKRFNRSNTYDTTNFFNKIFKQIKKA